MYQHGPRHVDVLAKDIEHGNAAQRPATLNATDEEPEPLDQAQHSNLRSQIARCFFFSQDRADITFIVNELCQRMSNSIQQSFAQLKRLV